MKRMPETSHMLQTSASNGSLYLDLMKKCMHVGEHLRRKRLVCSWISKMDNDEWQKVDD